MAAKTIALPKTVLVRLELILAAGAFLVPLLVPGPQFLTGTLVNFILLTFASELPKKSILPIVVLPGLGAVFHGMLFGVYTPFLLYFLPFIWLGNTALIVVFKSIQSSRSPVRAVVLGSIAKVGVIYLAAMVYVNLNIVPSLFLSAMGVIQFYTALMGGLLLIIFRNFIRRS